MPIAFKTPEGEGFSETEHFSLWRLSIDPRGDQEDLALWADQMNRGESLLTPQERVIWGIGHTAMQYESPLDSFNTDLRPE